VSVKIERTDRIASPSKLLDLRDCESPLFRRQYAELESLQWASHSIAARAVFRLFRRDWKLKPIWSRRWEYPWAIQNAGLESGFTVLDAGCGGSPLLPYLAQQWRDGLFLKGVDKGVERVLNWKGRLLDLIGYRAVEGFCPSLDKRVEILHESLSAMSLPDAFFDRIFCISVMEHIPQGAQRSVMNEMARVLKPSGLLLMTMDLPMDDASPAKYIVEGSGLRLIGDLDYSVPRLERHGLNYEVAGLVLEKL